MTRRPLLALALCSALTGCVSAPPVGPIAEYRPGSPSVTGKVTCDAKYALVAPDENGQQISYGEHQLRKGEQLGFRPETDGTVTAYAPGFTHTLPPGTYAWEVVASSVPSTSERMLCETGRCALTVAKAAGIVIGLLSCLLILLLVIG